LVCFQGCFQGLCGLPSCAAWFGIFKTIWVRTRAPMRRRTSALAAAAALATASALAATFAVAAASALSAARALAAACAFAAASALAATSALAAAAALASPPQPSPSPPSPSPPSPPQPSPSPPSPRGTPSVQFPLLEPRFSTLLMAVAWPRPAPPSRCGEARRTGESCWTRPRRSVGELGHRQSAYTAGYSELIRHACKRWANAFLYRCSHCNRPAGSAGGARMQ
jgi:hypothetical protein